MNIISKNAWNVVAVGIGLLGCGVAYASEAGNDQGAEKSVMATIKANQNMIVAVGMAGAALIVNQVFFMPFLVSAATGFASEVFILDNPKVKKFIIDKVNISDAPLGFGQGVADGLMYYGLTTLGGGIWSGVSAIPMTLGVAIGQAAGIAYNNTNYRKRIMYEWNKWQNKATDNPPQVSVKEIVARGSGAALSWLCFAGIIGKMYKAV